MFINFVENACRKLTQHGCREENPEQLIREGPENFGARDHFGVDFAQVLQCEVDFLPQTWHDVQSVQHLDAEVRHTMEVCG